MYRVSAVGVEPVMIRVSLEHNVSGLMRSRKLGIGMRPSLARSEDNAGCPSGFVRRSAS